jgi:hypothetical protein
MQLLWDRAFRLYVFLCLCVDRTSARLEIDQAGVAKSLALSLELTPHVYASFEEIRPRFSIKMRVHCPKFKGGGSRSQRRGNDAAYECYELALRLNSH